MVINSLSDLLSNTCIQLQLQQAADLVQQLNYYPVVFFRHVWQYAKEWTCPGSRVNDYMFRRN